MNIRAFVRTNIRVGVVEYVCGWMGGLYGSCFAGFSEKEREWCACACICACENVQVRFQMRTYLCVYLRVLECACVSVCVFVCTCMMFSNACKCMDAYAFIVIDQPAHSKCRGEQCGRLLVVPRLTTPATAVPGRERS